MLFLFGVVFCQGCATPQQARLYEGPIQAKLQKLEQEVFREAAQFEKFIDQKGAVFEDPGLDSYLGEVAQKLIPENLPDGRVHITFKVIRDPGLNAYSLPHGRIYLASGLLSKLGTESQLAFVMGHEISHVLNRDLIYFTDSFRKKTVTTKILDLIVTPATAAVGFGDLGQLTVNVVYIASVTGYGRELEARSDADGFRTIVAAGYDPEEVLKIYDIFIAERKKYKHPPEITFLSTHPSHQDRKEQIQELISASTLSSPPGPSPTAERLKPFVQKMRLENVSLNIRSSLFQHALDDLSDHLQENPADPKAHFYLGECYRLLAKNRKVLKEELSAKEWHKIEDVEETVQRKEWWERAEGAYLQAMSLDETYEGPHRGLGLLYEAQGKAEAALRHLETYLQLATNAKDRRFVEATMKRLMEELAKEEARGAATH